MEAEITVHVTQEDIDAGIKCDLESCPIAYAVSRAVGTDDVVVTSAGIYTGGCNYGSYHHTDESFEFMDDFDNNEDVKPFSFQLVKKWG